MLAILMEVFGQQMALKPQERFVLNVLNLVHPFIHPPTPIPKIMSTTQITCDNVVCLSCC
jgi:hypothetical protein